MKQPAILLGDCIERMKELPDNSVDAIVTDPPYGLGFMGKKWDYDVPSVEVWQECLRVLKPGGHLLAFAGTRTQHRMAVNIEDAGFEIRDMISWVYASGFPKSVDVSKAIDKAAGERGGRGPMKLGGERLYRLQNGKRDGEGRWGDESARNPYLYIAATEAAKQWNGWGTALKPSHEPLTWATKPLTTVPREVMARAEQAIGGLICLSLSHAKHVEIFLQSSPKECKEASVSALLIAAVHRGLSSADPSEVMGTFKSPETAKTILSIVESWSAILGAYCKRQNMPTTSTVIGLTTALRTFACLTSQTIAEFITPEGEQMLGQFISAPIAEQDLSGSSAKPAKSTSVHELVLWLTGQNIVNIAEPSFIPVASIASSVLRDAITSLGESVSPSLEPITVARKPLDGTVAANVLRYGTGAINVDGCRVGGNDITGWGGSGSAPHEKGLSRLGDEARPLMGRWPANLIHDGSEEVTALFPSNVKGGTWNRTKGARHFNNDGETTGYQTNYEDRTTGSAARFFYCAKASKADRDEGCEGMEIRRAADCVDRKEGSAGMNDPRAGAGRTSGARNHHPTVKPTALMRYLCRLVTPPNGTVLDPFMGSGSTGKAAILEGFQFIGIERDPEYHAIATARIQAAQGDLFATKEEQP